MSDPAATGDPTVDANDPVIHDAATLARREAEVTEEQHLDDRHATGEHYVSEEHRAPAPDDPLVDVYRDDIPAAAAGDPELNLGRGVDNI
jgi:hypothetical protein